MDASRWIGRTRALVLGLVFCAGISWTGSAQAPRARSLSQPSAEFAEPFTSVASVRELADGRALVADPRDQALLVVDFGSRSATTLGRVGRGPGEYTLPSQLFALPGDSTILVDAANGETMVVGAGGRGLRTIRFDEARVSGEVPWRRTPTAVDGRGRLYAMAPAYVLQAGSTPGRMLDSAVIVRWSLGGGSLDTVASVPLLAGTRDRGPTNRAFAVRPEWHVLPDGRVVLLVPDPYRLDVIARSGPRVRGASIPYRPVPVSAATRAAWEAEANRPRQIVRYDQQGQVAGVEFRAPPALTSAWEYPDVLPPFVNRGNRVAPDGTVWVQRLSSAPDSIVYDRLDARGHLVEQVTLPLRARLVGFGRRSVYVVRVDDDDLEYLQRFDLP